MSLVRRHPLITFFVLAYALSWWFVLIDPESLFPWGPSLAAIIVVTLTGGATRLKALLRRLILWRVGWIWYVAALGIPIVVTFTSVYLDVLLGAPAPSGADLGRFYNFFVVFPVIFLLGPLGEELGWRGFALPRLQAGHSAFSATLILAVFYAGWHLPLFVTDLGQYAYVPLVMAASFVYTWIFNNTAGSVLLAMLLHTSQGAMADFIFPMFTGVDDVRQFWLLAGLYVVVAIVVIVWARPEHLSRSNRKQEEAAQPADTRAAPRVV